MVSDLQNKLIRVPGFQPSLRTSETEKANRILLGETML